MTLSDDVELPPELDTSDWLTLAQLLERASEGSAEPLEALVNLGGALPAGVIGGHAREGAFTVLCTTAVEEVLASLRGTKALQQKRRKVEKTLKLLREIGPEHPSLNSHRYVSLRGKQGEPVWESYVEDRTTKAWRAWWYFTETQPHTILVAAVGPHPKRSLPALPPH
ncbi:hypothetical protein NJBCHELONAE_02120 [Mycobacteroides chelonae]|uniref:hypothetical protein n=1 Tax=Mycobacteroides chelonae TaxID=1774 RepID=UPI0021DCFAE3|nr:hypothetical protein [Mycobacteroides chelonae]GLE54901.1 hypothetical protein NJBCHELONAE_02120 [Mycobacteroides chelonae]